MSKMLWEFFVWGKRISSTVSSLVISDYSSFVAQFRSNNDEYNGDQVYFFSEYHPMHCEKICWLFSNWAGSVFPTASQFLPFLLLIYPVWLLVMVSSSLLLGAFTLPCLGSLPCLCCFQTLELYFPFLHYLEGGGLYWRMLHIFLLGRSHFISSQRQRFLDILESRYICAVSEEEKLWASVHASPKSYEFQQSSSSGKFVEVTFFRLSLIWLPQTVLPKPLVLFCHLIHYLSLEFFRCSFLAAANSGVSKKLVVRKKNSGSK